MYIPPYNALKKALEIHAETWANDETVTIPETLFKLLLQMVLAMNDFDNAAYLAANPDVQEAVQRGEVKSALLHYIGYGYFEGRPGGTAVVDRTWYSRTYPDVVQALQDGTTEVRSMEEHFHVIGAAEGRSPNASVIGDVHLWMTALRGEGTTS